MSYGTLEQKWHYTIFCHETSCLSDPHQLLWPQQHCVLVFHLNVTNVTTNHCGYCDANVSTIAMVFLKTAR